MKGGNAEGRGFPVASDTASSRLLVKKRTESMVQRLFSSSARSPILAERYVCCANLWTRRSPRRKRPLTTGCGWLYEGPPGDFAIYLGKLDTRGAGCLRFTVTGAGWTL